MTALRYDARYCMIHYNLLNNKLSKKRISLAQTITTPNEATPKKNVIIMAIEKDKQSFSVKMRHFYAEC